MKFTTPSGTIPAEAIKLSLSKQTIQWKTGRDQLAATVPGLYDVVLRMGSQSYRTAVHFNENGVANAISAVRPCFVLAKGKLNVGKAGADSANLSMLLSDASFVYQTNSALRIRILEGATLLVDRDFTELGHGQQSTDQFGKLIFTVQALPDSSVHQPDQQIFLQQRQGQAIAGVVGFDPRWAYQRPDPPDHRAHPGRTDLHHRREFLWCEPRDLLDVHAPLTADRLFLRQIRS